MAPTGHDPLSLGRAAWRSAGGMFPPTALPTLHACGLADGFDPDGNLVDSKIEAFLQTTYGFDWRRALERAQDHYTDTERADFATVDAALDPLLRAQGVALDVLRDAQIAVAKRPSRANSEALADAERAYAEAQLAIRPVAAARARIERQATARRAAEVARAHMTPRTFKDELGNVVKAPRAFGLDG